MRNLRTIICFLAVMLMSVTIAHADYSLHITAWDFQLSNGGGGFSGWLVPPPGVSNPGPGTQPSYTSAFPRRFFCVDDNNLVWSGAADYYPTSVSTLDAATWALNYGGIAKGGLGINANWQYENNTPGMDALFRYRMAAYLTTLYNKAGYDNNALQAAIWGATDVATGNGVMNAYYTLAKNYVATHPNDGIWKTLLVVSSWSTTVGLGPPQQVLSARVPEPAFLGVLALGLGAAYWIRRRRIA